MKEQRFRPSLRAVVCTIAGVGLALVYDGVAFLPLWAPHLPVSWSATVQHSGRPLRMGLALASLAALWWGLYGVHGGGDTLREGLRRHGDGLVLWVGVAVVLALLSFPAFVPG